MNRFKRYLSRWRKDPDFRTLVNSSGSLLITAVFALYNGWLGIVHASGWHGGICVYYLLLLLLRGMILRSEFPGSRKAGMHRKGAFILYGLLFFLLNLCLIAPFALMVKQQKPVSMTLIPAIIMAAYTVYKVSMAAVNLKRKRRSADPLIRLLRTINFADALVSIVTLQNTLIMVASGGVNQSMLPLTAVSSGVIWLMIVGLTARNVSYEYRMTGRQ